MNSMIRTAPAYQAPLRFVVVAGAHVLAAFVIAGALNMPAVVEEIRSHVITVPDIKDPTKITDPPRPNGDSTLKQIDDVDVLPPPPVDVGPVDDAHAAPPPGDGAITARGGSAVVPLQRVDVRVDPAHPLTQPEYPAASVRLEEQGVVVLEINVAPDGRVLEARVQQSSGHPRLDAAAVREALRRWRLLPARENGQPVTAWFRGRVSFRLQDAY